MNAIWIITIFVVIDDVLERLDHHDHVLAQVPDAEILTVAVVAAKYFQNHQERALLILQELGYLSGRLSVSRYNRRLHRLADWMALVPHLLGELIAQGEVFIIDSLPIPVCRRVRAWRCRKVRGRIYCGYCVAKKDKFFGWRLHLVCTPQGLPVRFVLVPAACHDLTPVHELLYGLPEGSRVLADKAYNSAPDEATLLADTGVRLVPMHKDNMAPNFWLDENDLRQHRHLIETLNSQGESMGLQRLRARTNEGLELKVHASLIALIATNDN
jgi:hypothetical protein